MPTLERLMVALGEEYVVTQPESRPYYEVRSADRHHEPSVFTQVWVHVELDDDSLAGLVNQIRHNFEFDAWN